MSPKMDLSLHHPSHPRQAVSVKNPLTKRRYNKHYAAAQACQLCPLHLLCSQKVVARGKLPCDVLFVGEAPGELEDTQGKPFIGRAGQVLDLMIAELMARKLKFTYAITNVVCCRPFARGQEITVPSKEAIAACRPRLIELIKLAKPQVIVALGKVAQSVMPIRLAEDAPPVINAYHPSYILRNGGAGSLEFKKTVLSLHNSLKKILG